MTEPVMKVALLAVLGSICTLLLRRSYAEMTVLLALAIFIFAIMASANLLRPLLDFMARVRSLSGLSSACFAPLLKCVGLAFVGRVAADLCRDAGQSAMASAVELAAAAGALYGALPLFTSLLEIGRAHV